MLKINLISKSKCFTGKTLRIDISEENFGGVPDNPISGSYVWFGDTEMLKV